MIDVTYALTEEKYTQDGKSGTSYGIAVYSKPEGNGSATVVASIRDITTDKVSITKLIDDCNRLKLSTIHLYDVVEDFLQR